MSVSLTYAMEISNKNQNMALLRKEHYKKKLQTNVVHISIWEKAYKVLAEIVNFIAMNAIMAFSTHKQYTFLK